MILKVGDIIKINQQYPDDWIEAQGSVGMIVGFGKRLYIPAAKVMVMGEIAEFDLDEVEKVNES
jgi:hypothetical protein